MTPSEVSELLTLASTVDNRTVAPETVTAVWYPALRLLENDDAIEGMRMHFRESDKYLVPAHVVTNARRARDIREREARRSQPAIESAQITLDREQFDRETAAAIEAARKRKEAGDGETH